MIIRSTIDRRLAALIVALVWGTGLTPAVVHAGTHPATRDGFVVGFGIGGAALDLEGVGGNEGSGIGNLRVGYALRRDLVLHYEGSAWYKDVGGSPGRTLAFLTNTVAATYFVKGTGVFLRGGLGIGLGHETVKYSEGNNGAAWQGGLAQLAAGGYEWRMTQQFALASRVEYTHQSIGPGTVGAISTVSGGQSVNLIAVAVDCNWYF